LDIQLQKDEDTTKTTLLPTEKESSQSEKKPLLSNSEDSTVNSQIQVSGNNNNNNGSEEEEQIIPIWGEQIVIDKKMVKLGEITIKKSRIVEKRQVNVELRKEKVTVKYPDGKKEEIT
jgi:stress response protein YsnF